MQKQKTLIVEHYSMFFTDHEGTVSSFQGAQDVILKKKLFSSIYTDRGSHYWLIPEEGGKVSQTQLTQFGRAVQVYSPEARARSERMFRSHLPAHNPEFKQKALEEGTAFIPRVGTPLIEDILCEHHERTVTPDNCVTLDGLTL